MNRTCENYCESRAQRERKIYISITHQIIVYTDMTYVILWNDNEIKLYEIVDNFYLYNTSCILENIFYRNSSFLLCESRKLTLTIFSNPLLRY